MGDITTHGCGKPGRAGLCSDEGTNFCLTCELGAEVERLKQERDEYFDSLAEKRQEVERLKAEQYQLASAAADWAARNIILKADIAALVTALDEVTTILGTFQGLTPATRAVAERFLKEEK